MMVSPAPGSRNPTSCCPFRRSPCPTNSLGWSSPNKSTVRLHPCGGILTRVNVGSCMSWFKRDKPLGETAKQPENGERKVRTEGLWQKCDGCRQIIWKKDLESNAGVCPKCGHHFRIDALTRLKLLFDCDYETFDNDLTSADPLGFVDSKPYRDRLLANRQATNLSDAVVAAAGSLDGRRVQ